jgi:hypothetical protein
VSKPHYLQIESAFPIQSDSDESFIGGLPKIPPTQELPKCKTCDAAQAFMFQVAFPEDHEWCGCSLAVFACVSCADETTLIPEMLKGRLKEAVIPESFLHLYQRNFALLTFETSCGELRKQYRAKVAFQRLTTSLERTKAIGKIGGAPEWLLEDESPKTYKNDIPMAFLMELYQGMQFDILDSAPHQIEIRIEGTPQRSTATYYQLFIGNHLYLFGTTTQSEHLVYAITQI